MYTFANGVDSECFNNGSSCGMSVGTPANSWMYNLFNNTTYWTITPYGGAGYHSVSPVVYLKSNVEIIYGDGTVDNSYFLKN